MNDRLAQTADLLPRAGSTRFVALAAFLLVSACVVAVGVRSGWLNSEIFALAARSGPAGMAGVVLVAVAMQLVWVPRMWSLIAAGALFGPLVGGALSVLADLLAATIAYGLAHGAGRAWVERMLASRPRVAQVTNLVARRRAAWTIAALRVCPVAHYTLVSYVAGLVGVPVRAFVLGTALGILPGAVLYPWVGDGALRPTSPIFLASVVILGLALALSAVGARRMLRTPTHTDSQP